MGARIPRLVRMVPVSGKLLGWCVMAGREVLVKVRGVAKTMLQGCSWVPNSVIGTR
jgi:hypothetical protein